MRQLALIFLGLFAVGCQSTPPPPRGELVLSIGTDVAVPELASRLRIDVYSMDGKWLDSRDVFLGNPDEWPASFSVVHPTDQGGPAEALVRLRAFPEGATRSYRGEANAPPEAFTPVIPPSSVDELCANPPTLAIGGEIVARRGRDPILPVAAFKGSADCKKYGNVVGSIAANVDITKAGHYFFAVTQVSAQLPGAPQTLQAQVTLELRRQCADNNSSIECASGVYLLPDGFGQAYYPVVEADLPPGKYSLVTGGVLTGNGVSDITLAAWSDDVPILTNAHTSVQQAESALGPWLLDDPTNTPLQEPDPHRSIDRLVHVSVTPHTRSFGRVLLRGDCEGRASLVGGSPGVIDASTALTCRDEADPAVPPSPPEVVVPLEAADAVASHGLEGEFAAGEPCAMDDSDDEFVCVPSGAFIAGAGDHYDEAALDSPPRTAALHRFFMDRYELTVADYRSDLASGLTLSTDDAAVDNPLHPSSAHAVKAEEELCTFSQKDLGREGLPLTCITWYGARAWCQFRGGDLPSSVQWEYVATRAGQSHKTIFPWGDTAPSCDCDGSDPTCVADVFDRDPFSRSSCIGDGFGPAPSHDLGGAMGDTSPLGIVGLAGNVREWTLDSALRFDHPCWSSLWDPVCWEPFATARVQRGGTFVRWAIPSTSTFYWQPAETPYDAGVRCVYVEKP